MCGGIELPSLQKTKNSNGRYYWHIVESKRINGKLTPISIAYLGTVENILNIINGYKNTKQSSHKNKYFSRSYGSVAALWDIAKEIGVVKILGSIFPESKRNGLSKGTSILLSAIHQVVEPGSKNDFVNWVNKTSLPSIAKFDAAKLTSQHFWEQMNEINENMLMEAEDKLIETIFSKYNFRLRESYIKSM